MTLGHNSLRCYLFNRNPPNQMERTRWREVFRAALEDQDQQQLWDTREVASGTYTVVLLNAGHELRTEKLVVKQ